MMERLPEYNLEPPADHGIITEPVSIKITLWLDVELPRRDLYRSYFEQDVQGLCAEIEHLIETHCWERPFVDSVTCDEVRDV